MAENHELRLKINATAAKKGSREFVGAINAIKASLKNLDRDASGVYTRLAKSARAAAKATRIKIGGVDARVLGNMTKFTNLQKTAKTNAVAMNRAMRSTGTAFTNAAAATSTQVRAQNLLVKGMRRTTEAATKQNAAFSGVVSAQNRAATSSGKLARSENAAATAGGRLAKSNAAVGASASVSGKNINGMTRNVRGLENAFNGGFQAASLFRTAIGVVTVGSFAKSVFDAGNNLDQFTVTMGIAASSTAEAAKEMKFIDALARDFGINLRTAREDFSKFAIASSLAGVSMKETENIFGSVSKAMAVLGKGAEDQKLAFLALEQMMSKGVISSEELRRQLGERLPGAVNLMARSIGVSTQELQKLLKAGKLISADVLPKFAAEIEKTFGPGLEAAMLRAGFAIGQVQTEMSKLLETAAKSGFMAELAVQVRELTSTLRSSGMQEAAANLGKGLAEAVHIGGTALNFLAENIETVGAVAKAVATVIAVSIGQRLVGSVVNAGLAAANAAKAYAILGGVMRNTGTIAGVTGTKMGASAVSTALAAKNATLLGKAIAGVGIFIRGALGPIGLLVTAIAFLPGLFSDTGEEVDKFATAYDAAFNRLGGANLRFITSANAVSELSIFDKAITGVNALVQAEEKLAVVLGSPAMIANIERISSSLAESPNKGLRDSVDTVKKLAAEYVNFDGSLTDLVAKGNELKQAIGTARGLAGEGSIRDALEQIAATADPLFAASSIVSLLRGEMEGLGDSGSRVVETTAAVRDMGRELEALTTGKITGELSTMSVAVQEALAAAPDGLETTLVSLGVTLEGLSGHVDTAGSEILELGNNFDGSQESIAGLTTALQSSLVSIREHGESTGRNTSTMEDNILAALSLVAAYANLAGSADDVGDANAAANAELAAHLSTMDGGIATVNALTSAFRSASAAARSSANAAGSIVSEIKEEIRVLGLTGSARAVADAGQTTRVKGLRDEQAAAVTAAQATLDLAESGVARAAAQEGLNNVLAANADKLEEVIGLEAALATTKDANKPGRGGGGRSKKEELTDLQKLIKATKEYTTSLNLENDALQLIADGQASSLESAKLMAASMAVTGGAVDATTQKLIEQREAAEQLNKALTAAADQPLKAWMDSVPNWRTVGKTLEVDIVESLSDAIANFAQTGKFDFESLGQSILASATKVVADKAVKEMLNLFGLGEGSEGGGLGGLFANLFGSEGDTDVLGGLNGGLDGEGGGQGAEIQAAMSNGGVEAGQTIANAMTQAGQQVGQQINSSGTQAGQTMGTQVRTAGTQAGQSIGTQVRAGGTAAGSAIQTSSQQGATSMNTAITTGGSQAAAAMGAATAGGGLGGLGGLAGGGGGGGGFMSLLPMLLGGLFSQGGVSTQPMATTSVPAAAFRNAPQFASGTTNTSGIPAILHENEAVIPLSGGRKIPVELGDDGAGGGRNVVVNQNFNISTPDADSFRKSQSQIAADAASSSQQALKANG